MCCNNHQLFDTDILAVITDKASTSDKEPKWSDFRQTLGENLLRNA